MYFDDQNLFFYLIDACGLYQVTVYIVHNVLRWLHDGMSHWFKILSEKRPINKKYAEHPSQPRMAHQKDLITVYNHKFLEVHLGFSTETHPGAPRQRSGRQQDGCGQAGEGKLWGSIGSEIASLETNMTLDKTHFSTGNTSSKGWFSIVILVNSGGVFQPGFCFWSNLRSNHWIWVLDPRLRY